MKKHILTLIISLPLISCSFDKTYSNREQDKQDAEKVTEKFYSLMSENNRKEAFQLFSNKFFQVTDKNKLNLMIQKTDEEYGKIENKKLSRWETLIVKGSNAKADYVLTYDVNRKLSQTEETFSLQKENDTIKIVGYRINYNIFKNK